MCIGICSPSARIAPRECIIQEAQITKENAAGLIKCLEHAVVATLGGYGGKQAMLKDVLVQLDTRLRAAFEEARV